jgi:hypothetical protein
MSVNRRTLVWAVPLASLALCAAPAAAQIGRLRRTVERVASGPSPEVAQLLSRIDTTRALFDQATRLLLKSSYVMEGAVGTAERRAEIRRELASVDSLEQRGGDNRVQLNAEDHAQRLEQATQQRQYEQHQLSEAQSRNVTAVGFNSTLALLYDAFALDEARHIIGEAQTAAQNIAADPAQLVFANRLRQAATVDMPAIVNAVPQQQRLGAAIHGAVQQAHAANQAVQVSEATGRSEAPRPIDISAI